MRHSAQWPFVVTRRSFARRGQRRCSAGHRRGKPPYFDLTRNLLEYAAYNTGGLFPVESRCDVSSKLIDGTAGPDVVLSVNDAARDLSALARLAGRNEQATPFRLPQEV